MEIATELHCVQAARWPDTGRHILAHYDAETVVVYQAYRAEIGHYAAKHGHFGGAFNYGRMSWIKPNFLWMMYRNGWGMKSDQEVTLAVRMKRTGFDEILRLAVYSSFAPQVYESHEIWRNAVAGSDVRLQWDPDHGPTGEPLERRAIQLGLRGEALQKYGRQWIVSIEDISAFVAEQYSLVVVRSPELRTPCESIYPMSDSTIMRKLGIVMSGEDEVI